IADELIALYAKRRAAKGFAFSPDTPWQREFEDAFPYEETPDQRRAIEEIKADMEKPEPMDRLLCGDVGFGKTEVAIRAAYKAVMDKKQVAVLVPTTVLAQQHYQTFSARFADFGVNNDVICRFRSAKEQKATIERLKESRVDVLIGTHAILNQKRVQFFDLGLLIVDEEQRFGVKQKEKIKKLAAGVDVLTLSATPIPRTLHMSLVGARDMSIIETPPAERFPVQSYVVEDSEVVLKNAIRRELRRGGQVYFVYNRVESIDLMRQRLEDLVPEARIQTGHGQMAEELLERVMVDFYEGRYDILLATSIVENGLDVANANTIIVYNADQFGLSQLYQMRGRVGRSNHMAFAYFVYQADKVLSEMAEKRLQAMKEFAELGAGFKIAMRDLEIRGAGNLLGAEQHGHIASVGFEMYSKLLDEAIQERRTGKPMEEKVEPVVDIEAEAYLDGAYIGDPMHKIEIYQRIAAIRKNAQIQDLLDELIDRFGEPTPVVMRLLEVARIRNYARDLGIRSIMEKPLFLEISFVEKPSFDPDGLLKLLGLFGRNVKMLPPPQQMLRIRLAAQYKKNITNFITRVMMLLAGEQGALARRDGAAKKTQKKGERRRA
ncbi:transcription-repair coupling factor, partial [uncultured Selenomonas sp.]|uniref:transcription-repair coupling factor n=1 Tax=uncultured Selenomonas sp. TaxID=159275 RepID=UPI0028DBB80F